MVSEFGLARGLMFEPPLCNLHLPICFICYKSKFAVCSIWIQILFLSISPYADMGSHVRDGVKEHDMHIEPKSCQRKLLGKLVVQHKLKQMD